MGEKIAPSLFRLVSDIEPHIGRRGIYFRLLRGGRISAFGCLHQLVGSMLIFITNWPRHQRVNVARAPIVRARQHSSTYRRNGRRILQRNNIKHIFFPTEQSTLLIS